MAGARLPVALGLDEEAACDDDEELEVARVVVDVRRVDERVVVVVVVVEVRRVVVVGVGRGAGAAPHSQFP